jgi:hypothetical protein
MFPDMVIIFKIELIVSSLGVKPENLRFSADEVFRE